MLPQATKKLLINKTCLFIKLVEFFLGNRLRDWMNISKGHQNVHFSSHASNLKYISSLLNRFSLWDNIMN